MKAAVSLSALAACILVSTDAGAAPVADSFGWAGFYLGANIAAVRGGSNWSASDPTGATSGAFDLPLHFDLMGGTGSYETGLQAGYNIVLPSHLLLGVEVDIAMPNSDVLVPYSLRGSQSTFTPSGQAQFEEAVILHGSARARLGYVDGRTLYYGTAGLAWAYDRQTRSQLAGTSPFGAALAGDSDAVLLWRFGWIAGAGIERQIAGNWTLRAEYLASYFGRKTSVFPLAAQSYDSNLSLQSLRIGLNYQIGDAAKFADLVARGPAALETDRFAFHGQFTYTQQYDPPFRAPYAGRNSLAPGMTRETADITLYAGLRLWDGAELWINPEIDQGFGLSNSVGAAGFPSGEAYKVGGEYPYTRLHRAFVRQTIDLGGEVQKVEAGLNQFSGSQTADRLVLTVGKFGVADIFDVNKYAHDPRTDFLNWTIIDAGTFDYAADAWAYTVGAAAEWYRGNWTVRGGLFDLSIAPNQTALDSRFEQFQWVGEIEHRHEIFGRQGKVAITGFLTRGRMGRFDEAIVAAALAGGPADVSAVRRYNSRGGVSVNVEQQLAANIGMFLRAGVADGRLEPYEFTDVDRTISGGLSVSGRQWGRENDTFGIAGVVNGISAVHQAYLDAGGTGILVGDGKLPNPGAEKIIETYYSFPVLAAKVTLDYQFIANPAYNRDRGPVSVLGVRVHSQF